MSDNPQPLGGNEMPRFGGIATFMRLPGASDPADLDAAVVGVPLDIGTSNRPGARFGPRGIRDESVLLRPYNMATRAAPFDSLRIDDIGDVAVNPYNLADAVARIEARYRELLADGLVTVTMGGDHTVVLPILRAAAAEHGPVGLVHVDAHTDINDAMFGEKIAHGTPFRRAVEEGLLDGPRVVQIGVRGTGYAADDFDWSRRQGFRVVQAEECWHRSLAPLMSEVRDQLGSGAGLPELRHRRLGPGLRPRHRDPRGGRADHRPGPGDHPGLPGPGAGGLRPGGGGPHLRHHRRHLAHRGQPALRDDLRPPRRRIPRLALEGSGQE